MDIQNRAKHFAKILLYLLAHRGLSGATVKQATRGARHLSLGVKLADPAELDKALALAEAIALSANVENCMAERRAGLLVYQYQLASGFWQSYTRQDLPNSQAIGLAEQRQPVNFTFDQPHALIAGSTGSGKSETIKSILLSLMTTYKPGELSIILADLEGDYTAFENASHLALPIAGTQQQIGGALLYA